MKVDESENPTYIPLFREVTHVSHSDHLTDAINEGINIFSNLSLAQIRNDWRFVRSVFRLLSPSGKSGKIAVSGDEPALYRLIPTGAKPFSILLFSEWYP